LVNSVGVKTVYGGIAEALQESNDRESPLQLKLGVLADNISYLGYIGAICVAVSFLFKQFIMDNHYSLRYDCKTLSPANLTTKTFIY
jgi:magnesium-transporting ATPase (P-type)